MNENFSEKLARKYKHLKWRVLAKLSPFYKKNILAEVQGKKMYLDLSDRVHCEILYTRGIWEENETLFLKKLIKKGMVVVDVGANVGYYTLIASEKVGLEGVVYAFEPEPSRHSLLEKNIASNSCKNVVLTQKAVSDKAGQSQLYLDPAHNQGGHSLCNTFGGSKSLGVMTTSLDDFFKDKEHPIHVIKMDIQGAEMAALNGMKNIIRKNSDLVIVTEFWPVGMQAFGYLPIEFLNTLVGHGFRLYLFNDQKHTVEPANAEQVMKACKDEIYLVCVKGHYQPS